MKTVVRFENVSKGYRLGLTRKSLPSIITQMIKKPRGHSSRKASEDQTLWALRDINFDLNQGQSLAFIGPNGAGKTTILKLMANITKPSSGLIETNGQLSALIELGAGFHPDLTGYENIKLNGTILGLKRQEIEQHIDEIIEFSELERFIDTPVKRYSSGMKVRLGFAVASCINPDILLVDEVLAVGDASFRQKCIDRIHELVKLGTSIIFVSHNLWLVQAVCSSAIYIDKGQIIYSGQTQEAINRYDRSLSKEQAKNYEIQESANVDPVADIEITKIAVIGSDGLEKDDLFHDHPAEVQVHYMAPRSYGEVTIVVRIVRSDGVTCCMLRSSLDDEKISLKQGTGVVSVVLDPLQLRGGTFYVQTMIRDAHDMYTISNKNSDWFFVSGSMLSNNEMNGVFEPNRSWKHQQLFESINGRQLGDQE